MNREYLIASILPVLGCLVATCSGGGDVTGPAPHKMEWLPELVDQSFTTAGLQLGHSPSPDLDRSEGLPFWALPGVERRETGREKEDRKRWEPVVAPIPAYNPTFGWTLGLVGGVIYTPPVAGETDSPWVTGVGGFYSETGSWGAGVAHKMNLADDRWRMLGPSPMPTCATTSTASAAMPAVWASRCP